MDIIDQKSLWFDTPDTNSLCRNGGNGPQHPSQIYAIKKYVNTGVSFLDYGSGSGTTLEALLKYAEDKNDFYVTYRGLDIIKKNTKWCKENFPGWDFQWNPTIHKIDEPDKSWDVVFSRHVVDHMESFEDAVDEHKRVAKDLVIVVMWVPLGEFDEHEIKNIIDGPLDNRKTYANEYTNRYSRRKVMDYLNGDSAWELVELTEGVGSEVSGHDWVFVLRRKK